MNRQFQTWSTALKNVLLRLYAEILQGGGGGGGRGNLGYLKKRGRSCKQRQGEH